VPTPISGARSSKEAARLTGSCTHRSRKRRAATFELVGALLLSVGNSTSRRLKRFQAMWARAQTASSRYACAGLQGFYVEQNEAGRESLGLAPRMLKLELTRGQSALLNPTKLFRMTTTRIRNETAPVWIDAPDSGAADELLILLRIRHPVEDLSRTQRRLQCNECSENQETCPLHTVSSHTVTMTFRTSLPQ
jgi:hypothetical protein